MYFNEYNKVESSTVTVAYDVGVTNIIKVHAIMTKPRANLTNGIKALNPIYRRGKIYKLYKT